MNKVLPRAKFAVATAAGLASIAIVTRAGGAAAFRWKWGLDLSADHPICVRATEAFVKIRKDTHGQLDIQAYPNSVLGNDPSMLNQLREGALEMLAYPGGLLDGLVPVTSIENLAFAFRSREVAFAAMDGDLGALIRREISAKQIMVLDRLFENGWRDITTGNRPIRTVDDMQGLKVRVSPGKLRVDTFRSMGASPVPVPSDEIYTALQTHICDAIDIPMSNAETLHLYEVQKYASITHHAWSGNWNLVNLEKWMSLPDGFRQVVRKRLNEAALAERRDNDILNRAFEDKLRRQGLVFNDADPSSFKAKLVAAGYYARWRGEFGERAWSTLEKYTGPLGA